MTKISLGASKGMIDSQEFDVVDNILTIVDEYRKAVSSVNKEHKQQIFELEMRTKEKLESLKQNLRKQLGMNT
jgi:hypothetical protein